MENDEKKQHAEAGEDGTGEDRAKAAQKPAAKSKEDRLAEALRANLRRRKSASKTRKAPQD
ncbi:hypothetical protein E1180_16865 [Roseibium denhamense]|uniref:Transcriptional regulator n=1 Tax=Roseibium denhamense TaxID=76305 RepID=A0ABY1P5Z3_9HYPH|nr:hypothetical protein [Roseibium denhamense]MTI07179.1 hypothetical protein [Roseibium denhamense]SMP26732.1 hypothetical protein SAMN06265374_2774 [Roseibium denhamense]